MEKQLTMRGGQTPVQRYWETLLPKVQAGETNGKAVAGAFIFSIHAKAFYDILVIEPLWSTLLPKVQAGAANG
jgi:hypothetical protein